MPRISRLRLRAFAHFLRQLHRPVVQEADLTACFLLGLQAAGDAPVTEDTEELRSCYRRFKADLLQLGGLETFKESGKQCGYLLGVTLKPGPEQFICSLDPFAYISHLSAMAWHGLTDRIPTTLFLTRPSKGLWKQLSETRLRAMLGELYTVHVRCGFAPYKALELHKLGGRPLRFWTSTRLDNAYQAAFKSVEGGQLRVATVGRCFLDMVREPALCGGIYHVMEVFSEYAYANLEQILTELDRHGNSLEKARVGYLLESLHPELEDNAFLRGWTDSVQRGGSRKLDPAGDYANTYSERWGLSINV